MDNMNLCSDSHDEVCYETGSCPVCRANEEIKEAHEKIERLKSEIEELKNQ